MADPTLDELAQWISANKDNKDVVGSPDWVSRTNQYRQRRSAGEQVAPVAAAPVEPAAPESSMFGDLWGRVKLGLGAAPSEEAPPADMPDIRDMRAEESPYSMGNRADRLMTSVITAAPDTGIAVYNAGARGLGYPQAQVDYLAPQMRANVGAKELPTDAPWYDRYGEGLASALVSGGMRGLIPGATGMAGSEAAYALGEKYGFDPETMALLGGFAGGAAPRLAENASRAAVASAYRGQGAPNAPALYDAADRIGARPTAGVLGNQDIRNQVQGLENMPGSGPTALRTARDALRTQFTGAAQDVPQVMGATMASEPVIGSAVQQAAGDALFDLTRRSSANQEALEQRVGLRTPVNAGAVDRLMTQTTQPGAAGPTTPEVSGPISARLGTLRSMYEQPPPGQQGPPAPRVAYEQFKDWNSILRQKVGDYEPISGHHANPIQAASREAMRNTAIQQGVPPWQFDVTQGRTRALEGEGGQRSVLEPITERNPGTAYKYLLKGGEQDPQRLADFSSAINASQGTTAGTATTNNILGSHLNRILEQTLLKRGGHAPGPINYAERIQGMHPQSLEQYAGGAGGAQQLRDVANLAQAWHRPTRQGGGTQALNASLGNVTNALTRPLVAAGTTGLAGADAGASALVAGIASKLPWHPINNVRANILNSDPALAGLAGRPTPFQPAMSMNDLRAAMAAMQGARSY